jgi:hypothetical protein
MQIEWQQVDRAGDGFDWPQAAPLQQSQVYAAACRAQGARLAHARFVEGKRGIGQALLLERRGIRLCLRGPVWAEPMSPAQQRVGLRLLARRGAGAGAAVLALPDTPVSGFGLVPLMTQRHVALWDLTPDAPALLADMQGKWRNRLTRSLRNGIVADPGTPCHLPELVAAEGAQRRARGYRALSADFTLSLAPANLRIWLWRSKGRIEASMCFVRHGTWASYHLGHTSPLAREAGAHGVMLWHAAQDLRAEGVETLDLGDVNTEDAPGLAHFKLGTGARLCALGPLCWVLPG